METSNKLYRILEPSVCCQSSPLKTLPLRPCRAVQPLSPSPALPAPRPAAALLHPILTATVVCLHSRYCAKPLTSESLVNIDAA